MSFVTINPSVKLINSASGRVVELFAREGDIVHALVQDGNGTIEFQTTEARALVEAHRVTLTPEQERLLEMEFAHG